MIKKRPPRLDVIFQRYDCPLFFITICALHRRKIGNLEKVHQVFQEYIARGERDFDVAVGRYVIMPNHMHLFVCGPPHFVLDRWVNGLKRSISIALGATKKCPLWQPGFFDHLLRNNESYAQKWQYVQDNPVRAGLVKQSDEWPYQGEFVHIDRV